jgi:hypothetical protein
MMDMEQGENRIDRIVDLTTIEKTEQFFVNCNEKHFFHCSNSHFSISEVQKRKFAHLFCTQANENASRVNQLKHDSINMASFCSANSSIGICFYINYYTLSIITSVFALQNRTELVEI